MLIIIVSQLLGGGIAMALSYLSLYDTTTPPTTVPSELVPRLCPQQYPMYDEDADCDNWDGVSGFTFNWQVMLNEIVCSFIFVSVILMVKLKEDHIKVTKDGISGALGVALTLLAMI